MFYPTTCVGLRYGSVTDMLSSFSWELDYHHYPIVRKRSVLSSSTRSVDLPAVRLSTLFNQLFRQLADVSLLCPYFALYIGNGIFTVSSIGFAVRLILRSRLTLIRLALIRNPQSSGGRVSRPPYRYSFLHLLFQHLQSGSSPNLRRSWNAPLPILAYPTASVYGFMPDYYPRPVARLVSCYALFE